MTQLEAIDARHSVRRYISNRLKQDVVDALQAKIDLCNREGRLHIQLVLDEKRDSADYSLTALSRAWKTIP